MNELEMTVTKYGFHWRGISVERTASNEKPKWRVLRIYALNGDCVEILTRPRSTKITVIPRPKK